MVDLDQLKLAIFERMRAVRARREDLNFERTDEVFIPPTQISPEDPFVHAVARAAAAELGAAPKFAVSGPANESYLLNNRGIPTLIIGPAGEKAHGPDEYVELDTIATAARIMVRTHDNLETN